VEYANYELNTEITSGTVCFYDKQRDMEKVYMKYNVRCRKPVEQFERETAKQLESQLIVR